MDFGLSEDQVLLDQTIRGFLADQVPIERVRELREDDCPNDRGTWSALAELGVTGALVPEAQGGSALSLLDAALISQALGHAATPTPFLASADLAALLRCSQPSKALFSEVLWQRRSHWPIDEVPRMSPKQRALIRRVVGDHQIPARGAIQALTNLTSLDLGYCNSPTLRAATC